MIQKQFQTFGDRKLNTKDPRKTDATQHDSIIFHTIQRVLSNYGKSHSYSTSDEGDTIMASGTVTTHQRKGTQYGRSHIYNASEDGDTMWQVAQLQHIRGRGHNYGRSHIYNTLEERDTIMAGHTVTTHQRKGTQL